MLGCHWGSGNDSCEHNIALSYFCSFVCKHIGLSLDTAGPGADKYHWADSPWNSITSTELFLVSWVMDRSPNSSAMAALFSCEGDATEPAACSSSAEPQSAVSVVVTWLRLSPCVIEPNTNRDPFTRIRKVSLSTDFPHKLEWSIGTVMTRVSISHNNSVLLRQKF